MKILIDMNLSPRWVESLKQEGIEAVHWSSVGSATASDDVLVKYAVTNNCVLMTHDLDFSAIIAASKKDKPSVIQIRSGDTRPETIGAHVKSAIIQMKQELTDGAVLTINPQNSRLRVLPFNPQ